MRVGLFIRGSLVVQGWLMLDLLVDRLLAQNRQLLLGINVAVEVEALVPGLVLQLELGVRVT